MKKPFLYETPLLPEGFRLPAAYLSLARLGQPMDLDPWQLMFSSMPLALTYYGAMLQRYPDKPLVPFALVNDESGLYNDGYVVLACFDGDDQTGDPMVYFHDYSIRSYPDWPERYSLRNFDEWMSMATAESEQYKADLDDE